VHAVKGEHDHHHEIWNQERGVEGVPLIEIPERIVEGIIAVVRTQVMADAVLRIEPEPGIRGCVLEERCKLDQRHLFGNRPMRFARKPARMEIVRVSRDLVQQALAEERISLHGAKAGIADDAAQLGLAAMMGRPDIAGLVARNGSSVICAEAQGQFEHLRAHDGPVGLQVLHVVED
jgi:hypothetical protein